MIVADVRVYREGLARSLQTRKAAWNVTTSSRQADAGARERAREGNDVVVIDTTVRDGLSLVRELRDEGPAKVLAVAVEDSASDILDYAQAGAAGYVSADVSLDDIVVAIEGIARGESVCSPQIAAQLFRRMSDRSDGLARASAATRALTVRERQVFDLIRQGLANKEIASRLNIAEPTVKTHVHNVLAKLDVSTRAQAAIEAVGTGARQPLLVAPKANGTVRVPGPSIGGIQHAR